MPENPASTNPALTEPASADADAPAPSAAAPGADRFDALPTDARRVGAHRAEQPRLRRRAIVLSVVIATVVLVAAGIVGTLWSSGQFGARTAAPTVPAAGPTAEPVVDTSYTVVILNATPQEGLGGTLSADVVAAGWSANDVTAGDAGSQDFETTTVFYADAADEGAARGLAQAIGGAEIEFSEAYQDGDTLQQLVIVIGLDRVTE